MVAATAVQGNIYLPLPAQFDFSQCLIFLNRNVDECLHYVKDDSWMKMIRLDEKLVIIRVSQSTDYLLIEPLNTILDNRQRNSLINYILEVFDLGTDLRPFYQQMRNDAVVGSLCQDYCGLRLLGIPDLFEALCWCIIGQQINLTFAYKLKKRLVQNVGERVRFEGTDYYSFPLPEVVAGMSPNDFSDWQFSNSKANYLIGVAKEIEQGKLTKEALQAMSMDGIEQRLMNLKGIGPWSTQYVMMKCLRIYTAFPLSDVGLQNAIGYRRGLGTKPSRQELIKLGADWHPWQAYVTFYLWHSLIK